MPLLLYERLHAAYGDLHWWPADTAYEVMVGAILTQNTAWMNVEKALANFDGQLSPAFVAVLPQDALSAIIRPAGFANQKAGYLKNVTAWFATYGNDAASVKETALRTPDSLHALRGELLDLKGVGPETADSILLYAFELPTFVVDAYTRRILSRVTGDAAPKGYDALKALFEAELDSALYANMHALLVEHAKRHCRAIPVCGGCALRAECAMPDAGGVGDGIISVSR
jgi:endonuclease-3 related protein